MALRALPDGYSDRSSGRSRLIARDDLRPALEAAGLLDDAPVEAWGADLGDVEGGRRPLRIVEIEGIDFPLLVKPLRRGGLLGPLLRRAAPVDRAYAEILVVETLRRAGVDTPPIVAARTLGPFRHSPFVTIELLIPLVPNARDLDEALHAATSPRARTALLAAAGRTVRGLHGEVVHQDLNLRNLLVREDGSVAVLDLGDSRIRPASRAAAARNLARLYRSAVKLGHAPPDRVGPDVVRFARAYAGDGWKETVRAAAGPFRRTLPFHRLGWWMGKGRKGRKERKERNERKERALARSGDAADRGT